ncbi:hypothetical protein [Pseudomonas putida]|uniref:hypothetical protein n=1 Tax=Pseudomonas putida TaxID=303 RepID=UPI0012D2C360|nr:hypothetical protein [Pseudomonas putida]
MTVPFDPQMLDDLRQALGLTHLRATEHLWLALEALSLAGTEVVLVEKAATPTLTSHDITTRILLDKYKK